MRCEATPTCRRPIWGSIEMRRLRSNRQGSAFVVDGLRRSVSGQGHRVADCAHVIRVGLRPPLLHYFAPPATRRPWPHASVACDVQEPQWFGSRLVAWPAQRSKGGGVGRRPSPGDMSGAGHPAGLPTRHPSHESSQDRIRLIPSRRLKHANSSIKFRLSRVAQRAVGQRR